MRTCLLLTFLLAGLAGFAQERCASAEYNLSITAGNIVDAQRLADAETFLQKHSAASLAQARTADNGVVRIPVVVHILYNNNTAEVSDLQVQSQLDALNKDFRRRNDDTLNTPFYFRQRAADVRIEFSLASADPRGRATNGIVRKYTSINTWLANDRIKFSAQGGDDAWDRKSYLNIWVGNLAAGAGYSSAPGCDAAKDGIVISTTAFGTIGKSGNYSKGRTTTHEVGHWLGLKHIWGDAACGDDGIGDTPSQSGYTTGCPTGTRSTCSNGETGDMYMNFMDYTADACMNLFTLGQKARMLASFATGGPREAMLNSRGLTSPAVEDNLALETSTTATIYPNPASTEINIFAGADRVGKWLNVLDATGVRVRTVQVTTALQKVSLSSLKPGVYFVKGEGISTRFIKL